LKKVEVTITKSENAEFIGIFRFSTLKFRAFIKLLAQLSTILSVGSVILRNLITFY